MAKLTFRKATVGDVGLIMEYIHKLARHVKRLGEVVATEESLKHWIFDENQAGVIFALEDGVEVGFAIYFLSFSTYISNVNIHLEDLFIDEDYRGKGYGKGLLGELARIAVENNYGRVEWTCLNWNQPSIDFYLSLGAEKKGWNTFYLTGENLRNLVI